MFYRLRDVSNVVQFGTGDIGVSPGIFDDPKNTIGTILLSPCEPGPIGRDIKAEVKCAFSHTVNDKTMLIFTDPMSIHVLVDALKECERLMIEDIKDKYRRPQQPCK